jgi:hypothetical protein
MVRNSIVAGNPGGDFNGNNRDIKFSLIGSSQSASLPPTVRNRPDANGNLVGSVNAPLDPRLDVLADYGGGVPSHRPLPNSPAVNLGDPNFTASEPWMSFDQRGIPYRRVVGGRIDAGAVEFVSAQDGDLNSDGILSAADIDAICSTIRQGSHSAPFDLDGSGQVNTADLDALLRNRLRTTRGDANVDGVFDSRDLVHVFTMGEYEDDVADNSTWADGDWNCDGEFDTRDMVAAFQDGGYV